MKDGCLFCTLYRDGDHVASTDGFSPVKLPASGPNLTPGWHTVDIVYTKGYFAVYYDGEQFTSYTSSNVTGMSGCFMHAAFATA